ncbi:hypothetical protein N9L68_05640 [bacterium]|nr:hypothetical protein [bacterium]
MDSTESAAAFSKAGLKTFEEGGSVVDDKPIRSVATLHRKASLRPVGEVVDRGDSGLSQRDGGSTPRDDEKDELEREGAELFGD